MQASTGLALEYHGARVRFTADFACEVDTYGSRYSRPEIHEFKTEKPMVNLYVFSVLIRHPASPLVPGVL